TRFSRDWSSDVCSSDLELMSGNHFEQLTYNRGESKFVLHDIQSAIRELPEDNYRALTMFLDGFNCRTAADSGRNGEDEDTRRPKIGRASCREGVQASAG